MELKHKKTKKRIEFENDRHFSEVKAQLNTFSLFR
jgi:hypothetical protein